MSVDPNRFRKVMGRFATGVVVVTTQSEGGLHGMTANAFSSVSLDPPLVLVCIDRANNTHRRVEASQSFGINMLPEDQEGVATRFAGALPRGKAAFEAIPHRLSRLGNPIVDTAIAWLDCRLYDAHPAGDHTIFVGRVEEAAAPLARRPPLLFYGSAYRQIRD